MKADFTAKYETEEAKYDEKMGTLDVFNNDISFATSSPFSERRVTRSMLSSASTLSPRLVRDDLARRRLRVTFADRNLVMIEDQPFRAQLSDTTGQSVSDFQ